MEDDSLLDDDTIVKETPPQSVTPGTFSKNLINRLGLHSQQPRSETASLDNNDAATTKLAPGCHSYAL